MNDTTFQGDGKVAYVPVVVNTKLTKRTNADCIRAMTDEELAEFITARQGVTHHNEHYEGTKLLWLDWLKEEEDDGDTY